MQVSQTAVALTDFMDSATSKRVARSYIKKTKQPIALGVKSASVEYPQVAMFTEGSKAPQQAGSVLVETMGDPKKLLNASDGKAVVLKDSGGRNEELSVVLMKEKLQIGGENHELYVASAATDARAIESSQLKSALVDFRNRVVADYHKNQVATQTYAATG